MFILIPYSPYIKKEDATESWLKKVRMQLAVLFFVGVFSSLLFALFLFPVLADSSYLAHFDLSMLSFPSYFFILYAFIGLCLGIYYLTSNPDYKAFNEKLKQYKTGEMILTNKLQDQKELMVPITYLLFMLIPFLFFTFSLIK